MSDFPRGASAVSNLHHIMLMAQTSGNHECEYQVWIDGIARGKISLLPYYLPGIASDTTYAAVWGGQRVYFGLLAGGPFRRLDQRHEIHVIYPINDRWCLVCELSVVVFEPHSWTELARYDHDEVLGRSWWSNDQLFVEDFQGCRLSFYPKVDPLDLTPMLLDT